VLEMRRNEAAGQRGILSEVAQKKRRKARAFGSGLHQEAATFSKRNTYKGSHRAVKGGGRGKKGVINARIIAIRSEASRPVGK